MSRRSQCVVPARQPGNWWGIGEFKKAFKVSAEDIKHLIDEGALEYSRSRVRTVYDGRTTFGVFITKRENACLKAGR